MTARELEKKIMSVGYVLAHESDGSHKQYKHPERSKLITIPFHGGKDISSGLANKILKQAGLK